MLRLALCLFFLCGCATEIGDECTSSAECGSGRICDRASKGGYCTITPCSPDSCPENSVCVEFENDESYCMGICDGSDDCRGGYTCDKTSAAHPFCVQTD